MKNKPTSNVIPFKKEDREVLSEAVSKPIKICGFGHKKYEGAKFSFKKENSLTIYLWGDKKVFANNETEGVYLDMFIDGKRQDVTKRKELLISIIGTLVDGFMNPDSYP